MKATAATAYNILKLANETGFTVEVKEGTILTVSKSFTPGSSAEFVQCDMDAPHILALLPSTSAGSVWGTDGSGVGAHGATERGQFSLNKSGGSKLVLKAVTKLLTEHVFINASSTPNTPKTPKTSMKNATAAPLATEVATAEPITAVKLALFRKDVKAALAARAKVLGTTVAKMEPAVLNEELIELRNNEGFISRFGSDEEFKMHFQATFKKELGIVGEYLGVAPTKLEELAQLPEPSAEVLAAEAQAAAADTDPLAGLEHKFYAVELQEEAAVAVGFDDVESARKYAKRRNAEKVLTQVATREQYADRNTEGSMLHKFNLLGKPYQMGEYAAPVMTVSKPGATAPAAPMTVAKGAAPAEQPAPATAKPAAAPKAAPAAKPAATGQPRDVAAMRAAEVAKQNPNPKLQPAPKGVTVPAPAEGAAPAVVLQHRLSTIKTPEELEAFLGEVAAAGHQLNLRARSKPVRLLYHFPSDTFEQVYNLRFAYTDDTTNGVASKAYLHCLTKYYEVVVAK